MIIFNPKSFEIIQKYCYLAKSHFTHYANTIKTASKIVGIVIIILILLNQVKNSTIFIPLRNFRTSIYENAWEVQALKSLANINYVTSSIIYFLICILTSSILFLIVSGKFKWEYLFSNNNKILSSWIISCYVISLVDPFNTFYRVNQSYLASSVICLLYIDKLIILVNQKTTQYIGQKVFSINCLSVVILILFASALTIVS